ncbi:serine/threonine protein kinase [Actinoalloteichus hoggarensis]|uniref:non-specific serine/threonine protein kinase n=1 Tax=Actinoalloteichus hoggarensis TaxID=1470176 RepID=A0A221W2A0_9PSEU|nr:serine/threonine-protein kinase [Actinoalloteichus hoggarensis]ASO19847.1 Serine/threonine-protein kinase PrkC [Actinoalloteichus hoggarensis]MBB5919444.1 serine/threonine protein kinase [Actinoalloteichus hoggarensis]
MDSVGGFAAALLSWLHRLVGANFCPGEWAWTVTGAGFLVGLIISFGSLIIAILRKGIGNRYNTGTGLLIGLIGVCTAFVIPLLMFRGVSDVISAAAAGSGPLAPEARFDMAEGVCVGRFTTQGEYLLSSGTVGDAIGADSALRWLHIAALVALPIVLIALVSWQGRLVARRGPIWPGVTLWAPFALLALFTVGLTAQVVVHLWVGLLPAVFLGALVLLAVGPPPHAVIEWSERSDSDEGDRRHQDQRRRDAEHAEELREARRLAQEDEQYQAMARRQPPSQQAAEAHRPPPTTRTGRPPEEPKPILPPHSTEVTPQAAEQPPRLADTPGPLPFFLGGAAPAGESARGESDSASGVDVPTLLGGHVPVSGSGAGRGRFRRIRRLGKGGFGEVWLAEDTSLNRQVAVKIAHAPDAETEERMLREARALAAVRHPHCVRIYDILEDLGDGTDGLAIVMEYIAGDQLSEVVRASGLLDDVAAARLWGTMAEALNAAHEKGLLHRDVKPGNILIDEAGAPQLIDFGIARSDGDSTLTATGMMVGTPDFLAPEVARGEPATPASDGWQLAATVAYALTGSPPRGYRDSPMSALMAAAQAADVVHLPERSRHRPRLIAALGPDPASRPTLTAITAEMTSFLNGSGAGDGSVTERLRPTDATPDSGGGPAEEATRPAAPVVPPGPAERGPGAAPNGPAGRPPLPPRRPGGAGGPGGPGGHPGPGRTDRGPAGPQSGPVAHGGPAPAPGVGGIGRPTGPPPTPGSSSVPPGRVGRPGFGGPAGAAGQVGPAQAGATGRQTGRVGPQRDMPDRADASGEEPTDVVRPPGGGPDPQAGPAPMPPTRVQGAPPPGQAGGPPPASPGGTRRFTSPFDQED